MNSTRHFACFATLAAFPVLLSAAADAAAQRYHGTTAVYAPGAPAAVTLVADEPGAPRKDIRIRHLAREPEMETVTFLGVETGPVSKTLISQLGLPDNAGLVVLHIVPDSGAASALQEHDILLKLDDQILIDQHQLSVLVRNRKEGDEVTLTLVRAGKQSTAKVKLTKHQVPKVSDVLRTLTIPHGGGRLGVASPSVADREETNRVLALIDRAHRGGPGADVRMRIDRDQGPGMRAMTIHPGNSDVVYSDEAGSLEIATKGKSRTLTAKKPNGDPLFNGPIDTPEQRRALPNEVRERLEKIESMDDVSFQADMDFEGAETKVFAPEGAPISLPRRAPGEAPRGPNVL